MRWLRRLDDKVVEGFTKAYLWLFDWTGVYVGSVIGVCVAAMVAQSISSPKLGWSSAALDTLLLLPIAVSRWIIQHSFDGKFYNDLAEMARTHWISLALRIVFILFMWVSFLRAPVWFWVTRDITFIALIYLTCVKIRPREPKKFFEEKLALQEVGS